MRTSVVLIAGLLALSACREDAQLPDGFCERIDLKEPLPPDMTAPLPKCAAAKGLVGDNLLCVDFSSISDGPLSSPPPTKLTGWDFTSMGGGCWEIAAGKLQVKSFNTFMSTCGFLMPALSAIDYQKYSSFTLSVVQTLDSFKSKQTAGIYLGQVIDSQQMWLSTGTNPRQVSTITVTKAALPNGGNGAYQPLFQITSGIMVGLNGWQIESIAINATP